MYRDVDMGGNVERQPLAGSRRTVRNGLWMIAAAILLFAVIAFLQRDRDRAGEPGSGPSPTARAAAETVAS